MYSVPLISPTDTSRDLVESPPVAAVASLNVRFGSAFVRLATSALVLAPKVWVSANSVPAALVVLRAEVWALRSLARFWAPRKVGMAMASSTAMINTTTMSSINVKPSSLLRAAARRSFRVCSMGVVLQVGWLRCRADGSTPWFGT